MRPVCQLAGAVLGERFRRCPWIRIHFRHWLLTRPDDHPPVHHLFRHHSGGRSRTGDRRRTAPAGKARHLGRRPSGGHMGPYGLRRCSRSYLSRGHAAELQPRRALERCAKSSRRKQVRRLTR